ncbi:MAG: tRNA (adenosine(37)-N6)-threonylcarbamoyltransferase complex ATPase subunit type 1 TsaE [Kiritimatiellae bacterium]|nr:tRNA (adenosine(37)-N6)-threonylcarbamoyltransferase complex ATPase subunit type 1 TsaE [Kiritimatiellia bacterium]
MKLQYRVHNVDETWGVAASFAEKLKPGDIVALEGDLGAGKTTFVQGVGAALGIRRPLTSPTFTISVEYKTPRFTFVHMDLYRLTGPDDLLAIGYPEYLETGAVVCIEWPDRAGNLIPRNAWHVVFSLTDEEEVRVLDISRNGGDA